MATLDAQAQRLEAAVAAILAHRAELEAGSPWPLAELYGTEAEASWGPPELLAHLDEMLPFWLGEVERILDADERGGPSPFGRVSDDSLRIGIIGRDRQYPQRELLARLGSEGPRVAARMRQLTDADAGRLGQHPTRGPFTVEALFERFVVGHLEEHVHQLDEILARPRP